MICQRFLWLCVSIRFCWCCRFGLPSCWRVSWGWDRPKENGLRSGSPKHHISDSIDFEELNFQKNYYQDRSSHHYICWDDTFWWWTWRLEVWWGIPVWIRVWVRRGLRPKQCPMVLRWRRSSGRGCPPLERRWCFSPVRCWVFVGHGWVSFRQGCSYSKIK